ncbi:hypothetical protein BC940DRAFT_337028 [Gongronella butleri]|nr:hypothetical protein BC940DRAFT_337028 [Gongronella butleri]
MIRKLRPYKHNVVLTAKVVELMVTVEGKDIDSPCVNEYLIADDSGCVMMRVTSKHVIENGQWIRVINAYTDVVDASLRVAVDNDKQIFPIDTPANNAINLSNNVSLINYVQWQ